MRARIGPARDLFLAAAAYIVLALVSIWRIPAGVIGSRRDWLTLFDPAAYIEAARWNHHVWTPLGTGTPIITPTIWSCVEALALLARVGIPVQEISRITVLAPLLLAALSMFSLAYFGARTSAAPAFAAGAIYAGGPVLFNKIVAGHIPYAIGYALLPLVLTGFIASLRTHGARSFSLLTCTAVLAMLCSNGEQFLLLVPVGLITIAILQRSGRSLLFAAVTFGGVLVFQLTSVVGILTQPHQIATNALFYPEEWIRENSVGLANALLLSGYQPGYWESALAINPRLFTGSLLVLFPLAVYGIGHRRRLWANAAGALFLVGIVILAGTQANFAAPLLNAVFSHFTPALIFKELYNFAIVPGIGFALLVALGLDAAFARPRLVANVWPRMVAFALLGVAIVAAYSSYGIELWVAGLLGALSLRSVAAHALPRNLARLTIAAAIVCYTYPTFFSGNFGDQLQSTGIPESDLRTAEALAAAPGWHRTLFLPAVQPMVIDDDRFGGDDPFQNGPGHLVATSFPSGPLSTALTNLQFGHASAAVPLLRSLGVRFVSERPDFHSQFLTFEPSPAEAAYRWNIASPFSDLGEAMAATGVTVYHGDNVARRTLDLGPASEVTGWSRSAPLPAQPLAAASILQRYPGTMLLRGVLDDIPSSAFTSYTGAVALPPIKDDISLVTRSLGVDPLEAWTATSLRWFQDPQIAGMPGIFTQSGLPYDVTLTVPQTARYRLWIAALTWGRGGTLAVALDGHLIARLATNSDSARVQGYTLPQTSLQSGAHRLTFTPQFGSAESDVVVAAALRPPAKMQASPLRTYLDVPAPDDAILYGRAVGPAMDVPTNAFNFQTMTAQAGATQAMARLHVIATKQLYLLQGPLPAKAGDHVLTIDSANRSGPPLRVAVWSNSRQYPLALRLLPGHDGIARIPVRAQQADLPLRLYFYGDATVTTNDDTIARISLQQVAPLRTATPQTTGLPAPIACSWLNAAHAECALHDTRARIIELKQSFNPEWRLCIRVGDRSCTDLAASSHVLGQGYDNAWLMPRGAKGDFGLYYAPDRYYAPAYSIQIWAFWLCTLCAIASLIYTSTIPGRNGNHLKSPSLE